MRHRNPLWILVVVESVGSLHCLLWFGRQGANPEMHRRRSRKGRLSRKLRRHGRLQFPNVSGVDAVATVVNVYGHLRRRTSTAGALLSEWESGNRLSRKGVRRAFLSDGQVPTMDELVYLDDLYGIVWGRNEAHHEGVSLRQRRPTRLLRSK